MLSPGALVDPAQGSMGEGDFPASVSWSAARYFDKVCELGKTAAWCGSRSTTRRPLAGSRGGMMTNSTSVTERWLRIDGSWYFVPE
jgi:hypothetical protein